MDVVKDLEKLQKAAQIDVWWRKWKKVWGFQGQAKVAYDDEA